MGNTFFYKKVKEDVDQLTWKDIFSESFKKHTKAERDHALAAGTALNRATEADMLSKWDKPFLWFPALKIGLVIVLVIYVLYYGYFNATGRDYPATTMMLVFIPPAVIPLVVLLFLWELNIPKNISLMECGAWWVVGGMLSLTLTGVIHVLSDKYAGMPLGDGVLPAYYAPLSEEPAKLIAAVLIIAFAARKRKIYGITGLVIGACVGAGFSAFESAGYAYNQLRLAGVDSVFNLELMRGWTAFGGHTLWCASYSAAVAYNMKDSKLSVNSFVNIDFFITFAFACLMHFMHNGGWLYAVYPEGVAAGINSIISVLSLDTFYYIVIIITIILEWLMLLWILKKCLAQLTSIGKYSHRAYVRSHEGIRRNDASSYQASMKLVCLGGAYKGKSWRIDDNRPVKIGRSSSCGIRLPEDTRGVSRNHCEISFSGGAFVLTDTNSSYGTYVNDKRLQPGKSVRIKPNDVIRLANGEVTFTLKTDQGGLL